MRDGMVVHRHWKLLKDFKRGIRSSDCCSRNMHGKLKPSSPKEDQLKGMAKVQEENLKVCTKIVGLERRGWI